MSLFVYVTFVSFYMNAFENGDCPMVSSSHHFPYPKKYYTHTRTHTYIKEPKEMLGPAHKHTHKRAHTIFPKPQINQPQSNMRAKFFSTLITYQQNSSETTTKNPSKIIEIYSLGILSIWIICQHEYKSYV